MKYFITIFFIPALLLASDYIKGFVKDSSTSEPVESVNITVKDSDNGTISLEKGYFDLKIKKYPVTLDFSHMNYNPRTLTIKNRETLVHYVKLEPKFTELEEVTAGASGHITELVIEKGHTSKITSVDISSSGDYYITASMDKTIKLWNKWGMLIRTFYGHEKGITSAKLSPDEKYIVSSSYDGTIRVWDISNSEELSVYKNYNTTREINFISKTKFSVVDWYNLFTFEISGKSLNLLNAKELDEVGYESPKLYKLTDKDFKKVDLSEAGTDYDIKGYRMNFIYNSERTFSPINYAYSNKNSKMLILDNLNELTYKPLSGRDIWEHDIEGHVEKVLFSNDDKYTFILTDLGLFIYENSTEKIYSRINSSKINCIAPVNDNDIIAGYKDGSVKLLSKDTEIKKSVPAHESAVTAIDFLDGNILTASKDNSVKLWKLNKKQSNKYEKGSKVFTDCFFNDNKFTLVSENIMREYSLTGERLNKTDIKIPDLGYFTGTFNDLKSISVVSEDSTNYTLDEDYHDRDRKYFPHMRINRLNFNDVIQVGHAEAHNYRITNYVKLEKLGFNRNCPVYYHGKKGMFMPFYYVYEKKAKSFSYYYNLLEYDIKSKKIIENEINLYDNNEKIIKIDKQKDRVEHDVLRDYFKSYTLSPDRKLIAFSNGDNRYSVIKLKKSSVNLDSIRFYNTDNKIDKLLFSKNNNYLAVSDTAGSITITDLKTMKVKSKITASDSHLNGLAFSNSEKFIASVSNDKKVKIYTADGDIYKEFEGHSNTINSISFSDDDRYVVTASDDATLKVWNIETGRHLTYHFLADKNTIITDENDNFFCYPRAVKYLQYVRGLNFVTDNELFKLHYRKDLVDKFYR